MIRISLKRENGDRLYLQLSIGSHVVLSRVLAISGIPHDQFLNLEVSDE